MNKDIIAWWSGGITSAVACKLSIDIFGKDRVRVIMIDTKNEHLDTYRFKEDCEVWYGLPIETISAIGDKFDSIQSVWRKYKTLTTSTGAICSTHLKRYVRERWEKKNPLFTHQVFGFEFEKKEFNRALSMTINNGVRTKAIYPLLMYAYDKGKCLDIVQEAGIKIPESYLLGFKNNNCLSTGCVQGGIGYWQKMKVTLPEQYDDMAALEHELTNLRGFPVTMLRDQSNESKKEILLDKKANMIFLKKHKDYPNHKCLDDFKIREVKPLFECNGMCGVNDLSERISTEQELNFNTEL